MVFITKTSVFSRIYHQYRYLSIKCNKEKEIMRYLFVAEKNAAAKNIAIILSQGTSRMREGRSPYNKIYEFDCMVRGTNSQVRMTSVSGHLLNYEFTSTHTKWHSCNPIELFDAPVIKECPEKRIKATLMDEAKHCGALIIWTDCDREGENIGFEILQVCRNAKPNLPVYRAKFSEITHNSIWRAIRNLEEPNLNISSAVDVRSELDLRTGAAFTRLQTMRLQKVFPNVLDQKLVSYGSCQFPTLGFVVERYKAIESFMPECFWYIDMSHTVSNMTTQFTWARHRLFDEKAVLVLLEMCLQSNLVRIENIVSKPKSKWRPLPLDTIEMEKIISRKLRINAKEVMKAAERLYTQGFVSYPRTETNIFPKDMNLAELVEQQRADTNWGAFAAGILNDGGPQPRQGKKSDQAHPPIHPTKYTNSLTGNEKSVYEYIVRHFLACVSKDAKGHETIVHANIANEKFTATGLVVLEKNYLEVYIYERWVGKEINNYQIGETFVPTKLEMGDGVTSPPSLLTEADLIALMEKHGIGTDATHAEHIETIKSREYVTLQQGMYFMPAALGMGLIEGYNNMDLQLSLAKPTLRSEFENDLKLICDGVKRADDVRRDQVRKYREVFAIVAEKMSVIDGTLANRLHEQPRAYRTTAAGPANDKPVLKCPKCNAPMELRPNGRAWCVICSGPNCKNVLSFLGDVKSVKQTNINCSNCGPAVYKLEFQFDNPFRGRSNPHFLCIGGCDHGVLAFLNVSLSSVRKNATSLPAYQSTLTTWVQGPSNRPPPPPPEPPQPPAAAVYQANGNDNDEDVTCNCSLPAITLTCRKGQNAGREFYKCPDNKLDSNDGCKFFQWKTGDNGDPPRAAAAVNRPPPTIARHNKAPNADDTLDGEVNCTCPKPAIVRECRNGPNTGREFYKCPDNTMAGGGCGFFQWKTEQNNAGNAPDNGAGAAAAALQCGCNQPAVLRTVHKQGPNTGRKFYGCGKPMDQACKFFKWEDEVDAPGNAQNRGGDDRASDFPSPKRRRRGRGDEAQGQGSSNNLKRAKRKCGLCHVEGHTRTTCPQNRAD